MREKKEKKKREGAFTHNITRLRRKIFIYMAVHTTTRGGCAGGKIKKKTNEGKGMGRTGEK